MRLEFLIWTSGMVSAGIFAYLAFRASLMYWNAEKAKGRAEQTSGPRTRRLFEGISHQLKTEAGWRQRDHILICVAIFFMIINQLLGFVGLFANA